MVVRNNRQLYLEVLLQGRNEPEYFLAPEYVIPDARAAEINVKVRVTAAHRHQAVLLHLNRRKNAVK
jgi:hypothetical protein